MIKILHDTKGYSVVELCNLAEVPRSSYYKWLNRKVSRSEAFNRGLATLIRDAYEERSGILGYRQMTIKLNREQDFKVNHKRVYRIMRILGLKSVCRRKRKRYIKSTPEITAENILSRNFEAVRFGEKWLTDVTEMKYGTAGKAYLSAILDLGDKSIVSFVLGHSNNNALVFKTFDLAQQAHPSVTPIFHSDRGFQYTSKHFRKKLDDAGMVQSMSRVSRCIDNGPMEAFWGMLKSEMYYLRKFDSYEELESAVSEYIDFYNNGRYQKRLDCMTPLEYRQYLSNIAA
ncbi:IS3 family transposase [Acidaminobacter hydrogenoformans]|uniref:Transposase InsO and inactivated derivatives n=3 Tax=Acidaminobacter hydrogenoformans DSM 2784 TaxID=1120920 RepID=A0A1G5S942_9FIRM|nr:IS3 family transposase [Acidaminobacter hydrogenoformans]SCZ82129.1 Transposase InsO and inactivated derivatives [Acidaminobacter hydrogenoformans DSM 2784]